MRGGGAPSSKTTSPPLLLWSSSGAVPVFAHESHCDGYLVLSNQPKKFEVDVHHFHFKAPKFLHSQHTKAANFPC